MAMKKTIALIALVAAVGTSAPRDLHAQFPADWTEPFPPFKIAGNLYYIGSKGLASYLMTGTGEPYPKAA